MRAGKPAGGPIFVLTGGPCAGKSTLIDELARRGRSVIREAAREVIVEGRLHPGRGALEFQCEVLRRQLLAETTRPPGVVFADRGIGDHFGYLDHYRRTRGSDLSGTNFFRDLEGAWEEARARYRAVFVLEQSPRFLRESHRLEEADEARAIHEALEAAYRARHPRVIPLPWTPLEERTDALLRLAEAEDIRT